MQHRRSREGAWIEMQKSVKISKGDTSLPRGSVD